MLASQRDGGWETPWSVYFSQAVTNSHRLIDTPATIEFRLNIIESDGRSLLELDPSYNHERFQVSHADAEDLAKNGEEWVRKGDAWIRLDVEKYERVAAGIEQLGLRRAGTGFTFPASQREQVIELFSTLGSLQHSQAFAEFLMKLADFQKIDDVPLPATLRPEFRLRSLPEARLQLAGVPASVRPQRNPRRRHGSGEDPPVLGGDPPCP